MFDRKTIASALASLFVVAGPAGAATVISYPDFSSTAGLQLNGATTVVGNELRLTPPSTGQGGSVFSTSTVSLASGASFSTFFQFRFTSPGVSDGLGTGADGITFMLQTNSNSVGGAGGGLGYQGIGNSVAIEFDTWNNGAGDNFSSNHVGIDVNGSLSSIALAEVIDDMNNGAIWSAWIDYDSASQLLEVRLAETASRPVAALLSANLDVANYLGSTNAYVGFSGATGSAWADQRILNWTLNDNYSPINDVPEPGTLALLGAAALALGARRRRTPR